MSLRPRAQAFERDLRQPETAQRRTLAEIISSLSMTEYGQHYGLRRRDGYPAFQSKLPIVTYDELSPWVERQMREENRALVAEEVRFYEKTSGSAGPAKYIPYTASLMRSFNAMFLLWLYDLLSAGPHFESGRAWVSISPSFGIGETTDRGKRVGLATDLEYLEGWPRRLLALFFVLPSEASGLTDSGDFKHILSLYLLAGNPEIISIWNPSFLTVVLDYLVAQRDDVLRDWERGRVVRGGVEFRFNKPGPERVRALTRDPIEWRHVLPALKLLSCWADENARSPAAYLQGLFAGVMLQGKGLLATEAPMTFPLIKSGGFVPLLHEVFFEFVDAHGNITRLHELELGQEYSILITQRGGLSRYRIGDRVRVTDFYVSTPCLEFAGRDDAMCDLVGEKLQEQFVKNALQHLPLNGSRFQTLVPIRLADRPCHYVLLVDRAAAGPEELSRQLDTLLQHSYRYRQARLLGQLDPARACISRNVQERFFEYFSAKGMKRGDIKHTYLVRDPVEGASLAACVR